MPLNEQRVRQIISEELLYKQALEEGIWDDVKQGAAKLIKAVTARIESLDVLGKVKDALKQMSSMPPEVQQAIDILKEAMQETGESVELGSTLQAAKEIGKISNDEMGAVLAADLKGPVHDRAAKLQNEGTFHVGLLNILTETATQHAFTENRSKKRLDEAGILGVMGLGLGGFGGVLILLRGLERLAKWVSAERTASVIHKVYHTLHTIEEKAIDLLIPNTLSFAIYNIMRKRGFAAQSDLKRGLTREEYDAGEGNAREKVEKLMYAGLLIFFAWNGIKAALHAGVGLLGFAEGAATTVKGIEIGQAAGLIGDIIELGVEVD